MNEMTMDRLEYLIKSNAFFLSHYTDLYKEKAKEKPTHETFGLLGLLTDNVHLLNELKKEIINAKTI